jgi:hypothetical protein
MKPLHFDMRVAFRVIHWAARIMGTLYAALVLLFAAAYILSPTGDGGTPAEMFPLALYPFGVCLALIAALRWPLAGGLVTLGCLIGFWVWLAIARGARGLPGPILIAFIPAIPYAIHGGRAHRIKDVHTAAPGAGRRGSADLPFRGRPEE